MLDNKKLTKKVRVKTKPPTPLRRPPRLEGEVAKSGIKPIRKKRKEIKK